MNVMSTVTLSHPDTGEALFHGQPTQVDGNDAHIRRFLQAGLLVRTDDEPAPAAVTTVQAAAKPAS